MDDERDRALERCCKMIRMAEDVRTLEGERSAARNRAHATIERWAFTQAEIARERGRVDARERPKMEARARHQRAVQEEFIRRRRTAAFAAANFAFAGPEAARPVHIEFDGNTMIFSFR